MKSYELVIFDVDGTLSDSKETIVEAVNGALTEFGLEPRSAERIHGLVGLPLGEIFGRLTAEVGRESDAHEIGEYYRTIYGGIAGRSTRTYQGIPELLAALQARGTTLAVATSKGRNGARKGLQAFDLLGYFACVMTAGDVENKKPHPEMVLKVLAELSADPAVTLMVGDAGYDIEMGARAGVDTCAVTYGFQSRAMLEPFKPTYMVDTVAELAALLGV